MTVKYFQNNKDRMQVVSCSHRFRILEFRLDEISGDESAALDMVVVEAAEDEVEEVDEVESIMESDVLLLIVDLCALLLFDDDDANETSCGCFGAYGSTTPPNRLLPFARLVFELAVMVFRFGTGGSLLVYISV